MNNKTKKAVMAVAAFTLMVLSVSFMSSADATDAGDDTTDSKTVYVEFVASSGDGTGTGDGSKNNPYLIVGGRNGSGTFPDGIENGDKLIVLAYDDIASNKNNDLGPEVTAGSYIIDKSVTIDGSLIPDAGRWNTTLVLSSGVKLTIQNLLFGELMITGTNDSSNEVKIVDCKFIIDRNSINYTESRVSEQVHNVRGQHTDIEVSECNFECKGLPDGITKSYAVYPLTNTTKLTVDSCTFDGYNSAINADLGGDVSITKNIFSNITNRAGTESGFAVQIAGIGTNVMSISNNKATSAMPVENGEGNTFLSVHNSFSSTEAVQFNENQMIGFEYGVKYKVKNDTESPATISADGNLFSTDGVTATKMNIGTTDENKVAQTNIQTEIPSEIPEEPTTPSNPEYDDDDELPFIPGQNVSQTSSDSDKTTLVAAAAAVVVIMLAVVALMVTRNH